MDKQKWQYTWVITIMDAIEKSHFAKILWEYNSKKNNN